MNSLFKNTTIFLLSLTLWFSCAPKLRSTITNPQEPLASDEFVLVLGLEDPFKNDGIHIGTLKASDNGLSSKCSYQEIMDHLIVLARESGGNILKITQHKAPDLYSSCNRMEAEVYLVPNYQKHERSIYWSDRRKLTWEDFKGKPRSTASELSGAETNTVIEFQSYAPRYLKPDIIITASIDCTRSWVRENQKDNDNLLRHEQLHFDISEVYARKMRKAINEEKINSTNVSEKVSRIFERIYGVYSKRQERYDEETDHGLDEKKQKEWELKISKELLDLSAYSR